MTERMACCVPFCRRRRGLRKGETSLPPEWICADHWRAVPRETRGRLNRAYRAWLRTRSDAAARLWWMRWEACRRQAIERGVGNP